MKKEAKHLFEKAIDSLILSIELFNRPNECARTHGVLIFLDHSFEMLLKASIVEKGGKIKPRKGNETIGFSSCLRKAFSDNKVKFLSEDQVLTLQALNGLRDAAQHYTLIISEQHLYIQAQASLTLFRDIVRKVFKKELATKLPERVLPLSTVPPTDIQAFFTTEVGEIKKLLAPGKRKKIDVNERLRALAILENSMQGIESQPSDEGLKELSDKIRKGLTFEDIFPGVASLNITQNGFGPSLDLRITKAGGIPVALVPEGTPGNAIVGIKRVAELDFFNLPTKKISDKLGIGMLKLVAVIKELNIQSDPEMYKEIKLGSQTHKRYSAKALKLLEEKLPDLDTDLIFKKYRTAKKSKKKAA